MTRPIIGTLSEKATHAYLKKQLEPNESFHEVPLLGYVCDVFDGSHIYEIQTQAFTKLKNKLDVFLPNYDVTIVYPLYKKRSIAWIDKESGEVVEIKRSSISASVFDLFYELYNLRDYISNPRFHVKVILLEGTEYKYLDGIGTRKKIKPTKIDKVPNRIIETYDFVSKDDYLTYLPYQNEETFTLKEFYTKLKTTNDAGYALLSIFMTLGIVNKIGKKGNAFLYQVNLKEKIYLDDLEDIVVY